MAYALVDILFLMVSTLLEILAKIHDGVLHPVALAPRSVSTLLEILGLVLLVVVGF